MLLSEPPQNPQLNRERMTEVMFETFNVPAMYCNVQAVLGLYAAGRTTGCVVDSGAGITHAVPIFEGYSLPHSIQKMDLAGQDITAYLTKLLTARGFEFTTPAEADVVNDMKEVLCYVAHDYKKEVADMKESTAGQRSYELPDGNAVTVGTERVQAAEALFNPMLLDREMPGLHETAFNCISKCDNEIRKDLYVKGWLCVWNHPVNTITLTCLFVVLLVLRSGTRT